MLCVSPGRCAKVWMHYGEALHFNEQQLFQATFWWHDVGCACVRLFNTGILPCVARPGVQVSGYQAVS